MGINLLFCCIPFTTVNANFEVEALGLAGLPHWSILALWALWPVPSENIGGPVNLNYDWFVRPADIFSSRRHVGETEGAMDSASVFFFCL